MIADNVRTRPGSGRDDEARHAVIDIGSNTVRLVIYGGPPRAPTVLWNEKVSARLGRDLARTGAIPDAAMEEALAALARFRLLAQELGIARIETVATAAAREASNGAEFTRRVTQLGLPLKVLSGEEEARASAWGVCGAFPGAKGVVADLGGGSLELVALDAGHRGRAATFPLGTLRLPALRSGADFEGHVARSIAGADWAREPGDLYMVGGTWRAFAAFAMARAEHALTDPHGLTLTAAEAARLAQSLAKKDAAQLAKGRGISTMRAATLPDAAALLSILLAELSPERLVFSSWGLREGLYFRSLPAPEQAQDPLLAGIADFSDSRYHPPEAAAQIARWTAEVFSRTAGEGGGRLRLAATHLALTLHRVEPNLRAAQALEWALDKRWIGIDFAQRAVLAAALRGSLGQTEPHPRLTGLAGEAALRAATGWGLAFRLARRLTGGALGPLEACRLSCDGGAIDLRIDDRYSALVAPTVEKTLGALAQWLGREPRISRR